MAALKPTILILKSSFSSCKSSKQRGIVAATISPGNRVGKISLPGMGAGGFVNKLELHRFTDEKQLSPIKVIEKIKRNEGVNGGDTLIVAELYSILEAVADRVEMHRNICEQRSNWNSLLLTSINGLILAAATMVGIASISGGAPAAALKLSSTILYVGATGLLSIMNKIQPSQLAEEQRNATRLFKQLQNQITTVLSIGNFTSFDVKELMEKVLALDKAYPLPLLGAMLEKFPENVEPAVWWSECRRKQPKRCVGFNGWNLKLEEEMREIVNIMERKDKQDYLRLSEKTLKLNKFLAVAAPMLTGLAAVGSALVGSPSHGCWAAVLGISCGALASVMNTLEHGGQVGMVFEMYRSNAGFFKMMEDTIAWNLREEDLERRENGEVLEMKVGLQLGRSLSQLRDLATAGEDQFASKLF
ncbi:probable F-box protein At4g22030 [Primulina huaijiensis]|uniref:probable F-box protein At4g22030 n=1 Tax=Primulina huaijiensis TaxID=1492673 RepID=UPI003CC7884F